MSSPVVDRVRAVPLIVEQGRLHNIPMEVEDISGFPFERDTDRGDAHFRSQLDDIAKRHPEFAEHLGNFRTGSGVRRQSSLGGADEPDFPTHRRFQRPNLASRFEKFGFPFDGDDFDPEKYAQQFYQPHQEEFHHPQQSQQQQPSGYSHQQQPSSYSQQQQQPSGYSQQPPPSYSPQQSASYSPQQQQQQPEYPQPEPQQQPSQPEPERSTNNIQQSNTVDLGQKQEPVNDRSQRSMSAPPPEKAQRFTSSINIPVNQQDQPEDMANKTTERIIPIHVEDRDEPVIPKKTAHNYGQQHSYAGNTQPETIFGRRPEEFTHFMNREPRQFDKWHSGFNNPEEFMRQQRFPQQQAPPTQQQRFPQQQAPPPQQQQQKGDIPIPVKVEVPHQAGQRTASPQPTPQQQAPPQQPQPAKQAPPQQKKPVTPLEQIQAIQEDVAALAAEVEKFEGKSKDKYYLYLDEMLTRNLLKLDNIDTQGKDDIRTARKEAIKSIEKTISVLEARAAGNVQPQVEKMEVEEKTEKVEEQSMETVDADASNKSENSQQMEVVPENAANSEEGVQKEEKKQSLEEQKVENATQDGVPVENRAVLVENNPEQAENRAVLVEKPAGEEAKMETCEGQESNLAVADAVKKFEGENKEKSEGESKAEESSQDDKAEDKKSKKKGKKKSEKK